MADLTDGDIRALAQASGVDLPPELLAEVGYSLNGVLEALEQAAAAMPGLADVEPLPIILPPPANQS